MNEATMDDDDTLQRHQQHLKTAKANEMNEDNTSMNPLTITTQKRSISGGLFSKFAFLRTTEQNDHSLAETHDTPPKSKKSIDDDEVGIRAEALQRRMSAADLSRSGTVKQRKRKGSLRKSALLGGRRLGSDSKDRKPSPLQSNAPQRQGHDMAADDNSASSQEGVNTQDAGSINKAKAAPFILGSASSSRSSLLSVNAEPPAGKYDPSVEQATTLTVQMRMGEDTSTTEEDDYAAITATGDAFMPRLPSQVSFVSTSEATAPPASYFPQQPPLRARPSATRLRPSPLQQTSPLVPEPYSYAETEYWGWVILLITWLLFTVGMGSCLDIWSWAWDVGETPYAPPELEDDPTLPIVGYYPALIVLTGVVAWIWITVAWVGMKYFRHAKIEV